MLKASLPILFLAISPLSMPVCAQERTISIELVSMKQSVGSVCKTYWKTLNKTGLNIAALTFKPTIIEKIGRVIMKPSFVFRNLEKDQLVAHEMLVNGQCSVVGTIKFNGIFQTLVIANNGVKSFNLDPDAIQLASDVAGVAVIP